MFEYFKTYAIGFGKFALPWLVVAGILYFNPFGDWFDDPKMDQAIASADAFSDRIESYDIADLGSMVGKAYAYASICNYEIRGQVFSNLVSAAGVPASSFQEGGSLWDEVKSGAETVVLLSTVSDENAEMRSMLCRSASADYGQYGQLIPGLFE